MKVKSIELTDAALDWAVCQALSRTVFKDKNFKITISGTGADALIYFSHPDESVSKVHASPSTDWRQGGAIIAQEGISWHCGNKSNWHAYGYGKHKNISGPTPLIAAMRCYVYDTFGEEVDIPEELLSLA